MLSSSNQKVNMRYEEVTESTKFFDHKKTLISPGYAFNKICSRNFNESASFVNLENVSDPFINCANTEVVRNIPEKNIVIINNAFITFMNFSF